MAKGNMLLGYSRGSVGDVTFYRAGGSQRARARNRQPNNPRTVKQMTQRSKFANAVKFFKQVNTGFFKYAFEDRKTNESDYNAFMRHNVALSGYIGASASKIADWPALGLWQLSAGSLPEIAAPFPQPSGAVAAGKRYYDLGVTITSTLQTVAALSNALINGNPSVWRQGDIVTFVCYRATNAATLPTVDTNESHTVITDYAQFILNTSDNTLLNTITANIGVTTVFAGTDTDGFYLGGSSSDMADVMDNDLYGTAVIHSRNTATGLEVSNSMMAWNKQDPVIVALSDSGSYYNSVIADWQAAAEAILQGAAAEQVSNLPFGRAAAYFSAGDTETMSLDYSNTLPNRGTITYRFTSPSNKIGIMLTDITDLTAISNTQIRIEGLGEYSYNASGSEYSDAQCIISFDITEPLTSSNKPDYVYIYFDNILIEAIYFN